MAGRGDFFSSLLKDVEFHLFDTGHFALEEDLDTIGPLIHDFLDRKVAANLRPITR